MSGAAEIAAIRDLAARLGAVSATLDTLITERERFVAAIAAHQAVRAAAELLRFADEGPASEHQAFADDTTEPLAEALLHACRLEADRLPSQHTEQREMLGQLAAACARYIEAWA